MKDNGTGGTPLAAADGVTVAEAAPGTSGAKTTLVLPAGYGGDQGQNVKELTSMGAGHRWSCKNGSPYSYKQKSIYL